MYMIFATFNGVAFIHMLLTAPETKGKTLEEMDDVFDSGLPAWKRMPESSRFDQLQKDIEAGNIKISGPVARAKAAVMKDEKFGTADNIEQPTAQLSSFEWWLYVVDVFVCNDHLSLILQDWEHGDLTRIPNFYLRPPCFVKILLLVQLIMT